MEKIIETILKHKQKELTSLIAIDIAGAFDNAWWPAIIKRMDNDNVPSDLIRIIKSYLNKEREVKFTYESETFYKKITKGCPQGGPLSPLLWNILLNDLLINFESINADIICYADDATIICWNKTIEGLKTASEHTLNYVIQWCNRNKLTISTEKTNLLYLHNREKIPIEYQIILWAVRAYKTTSSNCVHSLAKIPLLIDYIESRIIKYDLTHLSTEDIITYEPHAPSIVKSFLHAKMKENFDNTNEIFRSFFVSGIPRFFRPNFYNIQFITDHGNFGKFLATISAVKEPGCFCGGEIQDSKHLLMNCPIFRVYREDKFGRIGRLDEFVGNKESPELPKNKTFEELTEKLNTHFSPKRSIIVQRFIFVKRMQETEESVSQYLVAIKRLTATCEFWNFLEDSLRDKFVCGLSDSRIQKKILSEGNVSLARVMEIALSMEAAEQNIKLFHAGELEKSVDKLRIEMQRESKNGKRKCKHCGNLHRDSCRFKDAVCFKCRKREQASQQNRIHQMDDQGETKELIQKITCMRTPHDYRINTMTSDPPYTIRLKVEENVIDFELDTGSCLTLISENDFKKYLPNAQLKTFGMIVKTYDGTVVPILGEVIVKVEFQGKTSMLRAVVVKGFTFSMNIRDVSPIFHKARPVPFAIRTAVTEALENMVTKGYLYRVTLNRFWDTAAYPLPTQQDLFAILAKGKYFSKLDLISAYLQLEVAKSTQPFLTINTHKGLFRFRRMPFGLANAPSYFQSVMDRVLAGIEGVICYIDDVLIATVSVEKHLFVLKTVFLRLEKYNIELTKDKCKFVQREIEYFGHLIKEDGIRPLDHKVQALQKAKSPTNISELRSFLGLVNYYGKFIPNLPDLLRPLYELLHKKNCWSWTKECEKAIEKCKSSITSERVLVPYDTTLPLFLATDASQIGIGAVLSRHRRPGKTDHIEREALAIIYGVTNFHQFIYGRRFTLITDHKPLVSILGPKSGIPTLSTSRLQRWAIILSAYTYNIKFKKTQDHGNADLLSRLPVESGETSRLDNIYTLSYMEDLPITAEEIRIETQKDEVLSIVKCYTQHGWSERVPDHLSPYFQRKLELTVTESVYWMRKMKSVARSHFWWPNLDNEIEFLHPHETTKKAPSELFIGRSLRTRLSIIHTNLESRVKEQQARQMKYDHGFQQDEFGIDDMVCCRNFRGGDRWIPGRIVGRKGSRVYTVLIHGQVKSYHRDQIRKRWENGGDEDRQYGRHREETDIIVPEADMPNRGRSESPPIETARQQRDSGLVDQNDGGISGESSRSPDPEVSNEGPIPRRNPPRNRRPPSRYICV
ncbi:K02A2.6-like [Cordylochernes scorpioides]|uniref:RNA-directed DNA polymerase n=1 Tax=Cordylochernes scorpioides TaxID=51811 RepID=A0ABY6K7U2_9ARAC|nr:K02A2.6-like [Cordylochernes scorpioides]